MSTKTYAGYVYHLEGVNSHTTSGKGNMIICPCDTDDDDRIFRSRFGHKSSGNGPWMSVRRVVDADNPLTSGAFGICVGSIPGGYYSCGYTDYNVGVNLRIERSGSTYSRKWGFLLETMVYHSARKLGPSRYEVVYSNRALRTPYTTEDVFVANYGFKPAAVANAWGKTDYSSAYRIAKLATVTIYNSSVTVVHETDHKTSQYNTGTYRKFVSLDLTPPEATYLEFRDHAELYLLTGILPGPWARGLETAYTEACKNLPQAATNVAANVLEAAGLLTSLFTGDILGEIPKTARDAWLTYRYVYTTTKLDVRETRETFHRLSCLSQHNVVPSYGSYERGGTLYRVGYDIDTAQVVPTDVSTTLQRFGLELNALNIWDMIPYSFVVDWFLPIGQVIEYFQDLDACKYEPADLWFSITTVVDGYQIFVRLPGRKLSTLPYLQLKEVGSKTIALRIADAVALFAP